MKVRTRRQVAARNESYPTLLQPFGGFLDGVGMTIVTMPELPSIGLRARRT